MTSRRQSASVSKRVSVEENMLVKEEHSSTSKRPQVEDIGISPPKKKVTFRSTKVRRGKRTNKRRLSNRDVVSKHPDEEVYQVEKIVDKKLNSDETYLYFIKWIGWEETSNTWEPLDNLDGCEELLKDFELRWNEKEKLAENEKLGKGNLKKVSDQSSESSNSKVSTPANELVKKRTESSKAGSKEVDLAVEGKIAESVTTIVPVQIQKTPEDKNESINRPAVADVTATASQTVAVTQERSTTRPQAASRTRPQAAPRTRPPAAPTTSVVQTETSNDSDEEGFMEFDIMDKCPWDKVPKKLIGVVEIQGTLTYLVEWEHQKENQGVNEEQEPDRRLIIGNSFKIMYPAMVIKYYEAHINFIDDSHKATSATGQNVIATGVKQSGGIINLDLTGGGN